MIGTKKLNTLRNELQKALGKDPIAELERQIAAAKREGEGTEILEGLKRFLESPEKRKLRKHGVGVKKSARQGR